jgi:hypothetical protein
VQQVGELDQKTLNEGLFRVAERQGRAVSEEEERATEGGKKERKRLL